MFFAPTNQFWKKIWNMGVSKTTYLYFGSWEDSKLLGAKLIRVKIKLMSWASLSWVCWAKLIWVKSEFERWASLCQTDLSQKWIWDLIISSELSFSEPNYSESKLNLRAELLWAKLIWVKIEFESWASLSRSQLSWACFKNVFQYSELEFSRIFTLKIRLQSGTFRSFQIVF